MNNSYRIDVKDFGPIVKASVDFRPLTVFIGPSNTGKACLAVLLHALPKCLSGTDASLGRLEIERVMYRPFDPSMLLPTEVDKSFIDEEQEKTG